jgi:hypothetical protein
MIIRVENIKDSDVVLVVSELDKYIGKMYFYEFVECLDDTREPIEEDEHTWWFVDKVKINKLLKK